RVCGAGAKKVQTETNGDTAPREDCSAGNRQPRSKGIGHLVLGSLCNSGRQPIRSPVECASILRTPSLTAAERLVRRDLREARGRLDYRGAARPSPTLWKAEMPESAPV